MTRWKTLLTTFEPLKKNGWQMKEQRKKRKVPKNKFQPPKPPKNYRNCLLQCTKIVTYQLGTTEAVITSPLKPQHIITAWSLPRLSPNNSLQVT